MRRAIEAAQSTVEFETYELSGAAARDMADLLIGKAQEGLKVRCIFDEHALDDAAGKAAIERLQAFARGSDRLEVSVQPAREAAAAGGMIAGGAGTVAAHTHRKGLVLDGSTAFLGGMNVTDEERSGAWHDLHAQITGP